jgi:hypothetical protein
MSKASLQSSFSLGCAETAKNWDNREISPSAGGNGKLLVKDSRREDRSFGGCRTTVEAGGSGMGFGESVVWVGWKPEAVV